MTRTQPVWRSPASDWTLAAESVRTIDAIQPSVLATGHGRPMSGSVMQRHLHQLAEHFDEVARPRTGWYAAHPTAAGSWPPGCSPGN